MYSLDSKPWGLVSTEDFSIINTLYTGGLLSRGAYFREGAYYPDFTVSINLILDSKAMNLTFSYAGEGVPLFSFISFFYHSLFVLYSPHGLPFHFSLHLPGKDGCAGMASITLNGPQNDLTSQQLQELFDHCSDRLPRYVSRVE